MSGKNKTEVEKIFDKYRTVLDLIYNDMKKKGITCMMYAYTREGNQIDDDTKFIYSSHCGLSIYDYYLVKDDIERHMRDGLRRKDD